MSKEVKVKSAKVSKKAVKPAKVLKEVAKEVAKPAKVSKKTKKVVVVEAVASSSSSESSSESDDEATKVTQEVTEKAVEVTVAVAAESSSSDSSSEEEEVAAPVPVVTAVAEADSSSSSSGSEEETAKEVKVEEKAGSSSESSSDEEVEAPVVTKRKAEDVEVVEKKVKLDVQDSQDTTVFVGNLSWNVTEEMLAEVFASCGDVKSTRIITDRETGKGKGFGYVEFGSVADATKAIALTGTDVDGREIRVDISTPRAPRDNTGGRVEKPQSPPSTTLFLGNLSFNVTEEEIRSTFGTHGQIVSCRFPTDRETGAFKGFGYLEYAELSAATAAVAALNGENIGGRAIRLDFSQPRDNAAPSGGRGGGRGGSRGGRGGNDRGGRGGGRGRGGPPRGGRGSFGGKPQGTKTKFD